MSSPSELQHMFFDSVPGTFLTETVRCLLRSYRFAQDACTQYDSPEAHDVFSHVRRAHFQGDWRRTAQPFDRLHAAAVRNKSKNAYHTRVTAGRVILTESAVCSPGDVPRSAHFRKTYARRAQTAFPWQGIESKPAPDAPLYALLIHGPTRAGRVAVPEFAFIGFPTPECDDYVSRIDLRHVLDRVLPEFGVEPNPSSGENLDITAAAETVEEFVPRLKSNPDVDKKKA
jgi:hypothetical protein